MRFSATAAAEAGTAVPRGALLARDTRPALPRPARGGPTSLAASCSRPCSGDRAARRARGRGRTAFPRRRARRRSRVQAGWRTSAQPRLGAQRSRGRALGEVAMTLCLRGGGRSGVVSFDASALRWWRAASACAPRASGLVGPACSGHGALAHRPGVVGGAVRLDVRAPRGGPRPWSARLRRPAGGTARGRHPAPRRARPGR